MGERGALIPVGMGVGEGERVLGEREGVEEALGEREGVEEALGEASGRQAVSTMDPAGPTAALAVVPSPVPVVDCTTTGLT